MCTKHLSICENGGPTGGGELVGSKVESSGVNAKKGVRVWSGVGVGGGSGWMSTKN